MKERSGVNRRGAISRFGALVGSAALTACDFSQNELSPAQPMVQPENTPEIKVVVQRGMPVPTETKPPTPTETPSPTETPTPTETKPPTPTETPVPTETPGPSLRLEKEGKNKFDIWIKKITIISEGRKKQFVLHFDKNGIVSGDVDVFNEDGEVILSFGDKLAVSAIARNPDGVGTMRIYQNNEPRCGEFGGPKIDGTCTIQDPRTTDPKDYSQEAAPDPQGKVEFSVRARVSGDDNWSFPDIVRFSGRVK